MNVCFYVYMCIIYVLNPCWDAKKALSPLEQGLQMIVSHHVDADSLRTEPMSCERVAGILNC